MIDKILSPYCSHDPARRRLSADSSLPHARRRQRRICDAALLWGGLSLVLIGLNGCGGLGLSGGSVPIGNGPKVSVQAVAVLPEGQPLADATVVVHTLPSNQIVQTTTTDATGSFVATGVPSGGNVEVVISGANGVTLKAVAPLIGTTANPLPKNVDIGSVSLASTITAASIELEIASRPTDAANTVSTQLAPLTAAGQGEVGGGATSSGPDPLLTNNTLLQQVAKEVITETVNTELVTLNSQRDTASASTALEGLLSYVNALHGIVVVLTPAQKTQLITAQIQGLSYTPDHIAGALKAVGVQNANAAGVLAASAMERKLLPAFANSGSTLSPFEALLIAVDSSDVGGFNLQQKALPIYLVQLQGTQQASPQTAPLAQ